jgi:glycosyltransferase involved in cell wall biosynthesis
MKTKEVGILSVACFGAIRPLKNQLIQAIAAIEYARENNIGLKFHINGDRLEQKGDTVLKNIRELFKGLPEQFTLVEHPWYTHEEFLKVASQMDIGLQMSMTETFNIVAADLVNCGVPIVVSPEIAWASSLFQANPTDVEDIIEKMDRALWMKKRFPFIDLNRNGLEKYLRNSRKIWLSYIN